MVVDSSALIAILQDECEAKQFLDRIEAASVRLVSAATFVKTSMPILARQKQAGLEIFNAFLHDLRFEIVPVTADQATLAVDAFRRFGKGRHPAGLNFGDCFSYALAKATGEPLLFKGDDFSQTDIERAV